MKGTGFYLLKAESEDRLPAAYQIQLPINIDGSYIINAAVKLSAVTHP